MMHFPLCLIISHCLHLTLSRSSAVLSSFAARQSANPQDTCEIESIIGRVGSQTGCYLYLYSLSYGWILISSLPINKAEMRWFQRLEGFRILILSIHIYINMYSMHLYIIQYILYNINILIYKHIKYKYIHMYNIYSIKYINICLL